MTSRREQAEIAQRLRTDGGGGEGLTITAIAREMNISVSYASSLIADPTGEMERARKRKYLKRCKTCGVLCHGEYCRDHSAKERGKKRRKWDEGMVIEAMQEWDVMTGNPPTIKDWWVREGLPEWCPTYKTVYRVFGKGGWNKAMEAAGFEPRPAQFPEWHVQDESNRPHRTMGPEARERLSSERKALYEENPDHPMFTGLKEGWDIQFHHRERRDRRFAAKQVPRK